ncbi:hypothetical protein ACS0TY_019688 [Phlomoides rotata]
MKGAGVAAVIAVMAVVSMVVQQGQAVDCGVVDVALAPCLTYLQGSGAEHPPQACCDGVKKVKSLSQTTADKRAACACVKAAAIRISGLQDTTAQGLPSKCGVQLDIPVSRTVDCDKIAFGIESMVA